MVFFRLLAFCLLCSLMLAGVGQCQTSGHDSYGDPLPAGAVGRVGTVRFRHHNMIVFAAFLPDGKSTLSVSDDGVICAWKFPSGKETRRFEALANSAVKVTSATLSPDGKHLTVFCDDGFMRILDWVNAKELGKVTGGVGGKTSTLPKALVMTGLQTVTTTPAIDPVYSPDGKTLMVLGSPRVLQFVDLSTGKEIGPGPGHTGPLTSILYSRDGGKMLAKDTKSTHTWSITGKHLGTIIIKLPPMRGNPTEISPDGLLGVTVPGFAIPAAARAAKTRDAVLFDTVSGKVIARIELDAESGVIYRKPLLFSPDGKLLAIVGVKEKIQLHDVLSGKLLRTLDTGPDSPVGKGGRGVFARFPSQKMLFSPDGKTLAFQAVPGAPIQILDTATGKQIHELPPIVGNLTAQSVFSPNGRCLAMERSDGTVTLYELATGQPRCTFGNESPGRQGTKVAIAPDGKLVAISGPDGSVHVHDMLTGKELTAFKGHTMAVNALAFAPNGKTLASASDDTTALIWDITKVTRSNPPAKALQPGDLENWWQRLAGDDAAKAFGAMGSFAGLPEDAIAWIKDRVKPASVPDMKRVEMLMKQLNDDQFRVRDKATGELFKIGELVLPVIDKALTETRSPESEQRLKELRTRMTSTMLQGERVRTMRVVEVLELIGTPHARHVLQTLADGAPGALVTTSAQAALKR